MRTFMEFDFTDVWDGICYMVDDAEMYIPEPQIIVIRTLTNLENDMDAVANGFIRGTFSQDGFKAVTDYLQTASDKISFMKGYFHTD
jgi:hypothetical protein